MDKNTQLRSIRDSQNKTITEVAKALKIGISRYYMIESGDRPATPELVKKISDFFGVKPEEIFLPQSFTVRKLDDDHCSVKTGTDA